MSEQLPLHDAAPDKLAFLTRCAKMVIDEDVTTAAFVLVRPNGAVYSAFFGDRAMIPEAGAALNDTLRQVLLGTLPATPPDAPLPTMQRGAGEAYEEDNYVD